jgi:LmbE family N-acetylglucosaminyl deacetylase
MTPLRILIIGAHPDDADLKAGGCAAKWCRSGQRVCLVSMTDGSAGHQDRRGAALAERRREEARAAAAVIGATYEVFNYPDGELQPDLPTRHRLIRFIRVFRPDLILTHRPNDYHPDHRYTSILVQDAAYLLTVPAICPETPHLARTPVILYLSDTFTRPVPFHPDVLVDIGDELDCVVGMLDKHVSQFYEWLPYNGGYLDLVPDGEAERQAWLKERIARSIRPLAERYRDLLVRTYGPEQGRRIEYVEAFEVSEYGAPLDALARARLFPFVPGWPEEGGEAPGAEAGDLRTSD